MTHRRPDAASLLIAAAASLCGCVDSSGAAADAAASGGVAESDYLQQAFEGITYWVYVPTTYDGEPMPLLVYLHGALNSAIDQAGMTGWGRLAEEQGFIAVFPQAPDPLRAWWFDDAANSTARDAGDGRLIAGITRDVMARWRVDPKRVWLDGYSAGGTMASVMAATYPDLFAAVAMVEGCPYLCVDDVGLLAYQAMGPYARPMPMFIVTGTFGGFVAGGVGALEQWLGTDDFADDGMLNLSVGRLPAKTVNGISDRGFPYTKESYADAAGAPLIERWVIQAMSHEYPEPGGDLPDATAGAYEFFVAHPMP